LDRLIQELEFAVRDHRVLVFFSKELLLEQHLDAGGTLIGVLALKKTNGTRVLVAAKDQLLFFLPLCELAPGRERGGPNDRHDAHSDQEHHHRVSAVAAASLTG
jgi:hypothetical protein